MRRAGCGGGRCDELLSMDVRVNEGVRTDELGRGEAIVDMLFYVL